MEQYDGCLRDSNYSDFSAQILMLTSLFSGAVDERDTEVVALDSFMEKCEKARASDFSILLYKYNYIAEDALQRGLVRAENGQAVVHGDPEDVYKEAHIFSVAPKTIVWKTREVEFRMNPELLFSDDSDIRAIYVAFEDGDSFSRIYPFRKIKHCYNEDGVKRVRFKVVLDSGKELLSQTKILVDSSSDLFLKSGARSVDTIPIPATDEHSGGQLTILYTGSRKILRRPLIIAEGYELTKLSPNLGVKLDDFSGILTGQVATQNELLSQFDLVYLDYNDGADDIWRNANLMKDAIRWVNRHKGSTPNVVMGYSMGGLVAAIALRQMEIAGEDHQASKYISMDSPHQGANVPYGALCFIEDLLNMKLRKNLERLLKNSRKTKKSEKFTSNMSLDVIKEILTTGATPQLIAQNVDPQAQRIHEEFMRKYHELGLPQKTENVAFSNGDMSGKKLLFPGDDMFVVKASLRPGFGYFVQTILRFIISIRADDSLVSTLLNLIPGVSWVSANLNIRAVGKKKTWPRYPVYSFKIAFHRLHLFVFPTVKYFHNTTRYSPESCLALDGAPGSFFPLSKDNLEQEISDGQGCLYHFFLLKYGMKSHLKQDKFSFIPRNSALYLDDWGSDLEEELNTNELLWKKRTPFDRIYGSSTSRSHMELSSHGEALKLELEGKTSYTPTVNGPSAVKEYVGDPYTYSISSPLPDFNYQFFVSPGFEELSRTEHSITLRYVGARPSPTCLRYFHVYVGARAYINTPNGKEYVGKTGFKGSYVGTPDPMHITAKQLKMNFKLSDSNTKEFFLPAILLTWRGGGDVWDAEWRCDETNENYNTRNYIREYAKKQELDSDSLDNSMALIGAYEEDAESHLYKAKPGAGVFATNGLVDEELPIGPFPPKPYPPLPPPIPPYTPEEGPKEEEMGTSYTVPDSYYVFVPSFISRLKGKATLQVRLSNELGTGDWSSKFEYRQYDGNEENTQQESDVLLVPSVVVDGKGTIMSNNDSPLVEEGAKLYMEIWTDQGEKVRSWYVKTGETVDLSFLPSGKYFARFVSRGRAFIQHFMKE
ncbi:hypothetical protein PORCRE_1762 [Porphyromonas crevioricanis JCM 15906]|uniref:Uncharacterized protein n=1 Tax=Porphyromonas crevioricanis JCM 15906 TaxID=1305617 RepID=T1CQB2_9PORP|nr:hypothetical protein [Porphyromonas crevioricanis]GAD06042.1 hypothetical protein PORCRE_1762 [Porphyromonas crevioricanis JCM 15906]